MKNVTLRRWAFLFLLLLAGPAWAQPAWQWASKGISSGTNGSSVVVSSVIDGAGNTVVAGYFSGTLDLGTTTLVSAGGFDVFVGRLSPTGQWLQASRAGSNLDDIPTSMALDATGTATVVGIVINISGGGTSSFTADFGLTTLTGYVFSSFVARLSPAGTWTQALLIRPTTSTTNAVALASTIVTDAAGNAVVVGNFQGTLTLGTTTLVSASSWQDIFVARLTPAGQWIQALQAADPSSTGIGGVSAVALDATGSLVLAGSFSGSIHFGPTPTLVSAGNNDLFVARLSPTNQWVQAVQAGGAGEERIRALALDGAGNVVVGGEFGSAISTVSTVTIGNTTLTSEGQTDVFVARLDATGNWTQAVRGGGPNNDALYALVADGTGNVIAAGSFGAGSPAASSSSATFGTSTLTSAGSSDAFVARFNAAGQWAQALAAGGPLADAAYSLALAPNGAVMVGGGFIGMAAFAPLALSSAGTNRAAFIARLGGLVTAARAASPAEIFTLAPNPATAQVHLAWPEASATPRPVQVLDGMGRQVRQQVLPARATSAALDVQGLASGLYLVRCGAATGRLVVE